MMIIYDSQPALFDDRRPRLLRTSAGRGPRLWRSSADRGPRPLRSWTAADLGKEDLESKGFEIKPLTKGFSNLVWVTEKNGQPLVLKRYT